MKTPTPKLRMIKSHWERAEDFEHYLYAQIEEHKYKLIEFYSAPPSCNFRAIMTFPGGTEFSADGRMSSMVASALAVIKNKRLFVFENSRMRGCAGRAWTHNAQYLSEKAGVIAINSKMFDVMDPNEDEELRDTLIHELCHILTPGDRHGKIWKKSMEVFGLEPKRCHDNDVPNKRQWKRYELTCKKCSKKYSATATILRRRAPEGVAGCKCGAEIYLPNDVWDDITKNDGNREEEYIF